MLSKNNFIFCLLVALTFGAVSAQSQRTQDYTIPLSNPGAPGKLRVSLHDGGVAVEGHSGREVVVTVIAHEGDEPKSASREGLKRIPNTGMHFEIEESDNVVHVSGNHRGRTDFVVKVPQQFSLAINTHHNGEVKVNNVTGEIEIDGHHDDIILTNVGGTVVADTHHGDIKVSFASVKQGTPMAFSSYHGDIDITFPAGTGATVKLKSERGDIYTDFDLKTSMPKPSLQNTSEGSKKIVVDSWIQGTIGSGGPEYLFNTHHGDIILRKK